MNIPMRRPPIVNGKIRHGLTRHPLYKKWSSMRSRCHNFRDTVFHNYGARGIKVCDRWDSFTVFLDDMEESYEPGLSIDRIDVNGDYCPENCRWATVLQQAQNKRKAP